MNHTVLLHRTLFTVALGLLAQTGSLPAQAAKPTVPVFQDGMAQVVDGFKNPKDWIQHHLWVETEFDSDGDGKLDRVHVDVTRPGQTDSEGLKVAVVYETSPYFSGVASGNRFFWDPNHELGAKPPKRKAAPNIRFQNRPGMISRSLIRAWVPRGFAVVHSASPGTGLSQGCPTVGGENEELAPKAVIDWLNGRAKGFTTPDGNKTVEAYWATGKVGMTGTSYNGTLPIAAATTGVDGLEAIIPDAPNTSYYHYYRSHGLVRHPGGYMGEDIDVLYDFINSGNPRMRKSCNKTVRDELMADNQDRLTGDYNAFWHSRNYRERLDKVRAATLISHGFNDWNVMPNHSVSIYQGLKERGVPVMAYFHQGGHGGPPPFDMMNRWFSRYLYGVENQVEEMPRAWVVREGDPRSKPTSYAEYPHPDSEQVTLHLQAGGQAWGGLTLRAADQEQGVETLIDNVEQKGSKLADAQKSKHRLLYVTKKLQWPLHLSGTPRLRIRMASSRSAANLSVWLVSLPWDETGVINDNIITRGWADPQNHASLEESQPLKKGQFVEFSFELQPDDQVIPVGQHIGLMIFSSDRDFTLWPKPGTKLSIDLDATQFELPVVGGAEAMALAVGAEK
ncbi:MAG: Xaa-Pro dipeptidyl-peptidase [Planctomycetota bacterium]|nr:MAG: Xaa-Pro dipeptidyl-peptidase [Planctomycetota bacterium]